MRTRFRSICGPFLLAILILFVTPFAFAHIRIYPTESTFGAREKYTMRVPNERPSPAIHTNQNEF